jgi:hypothetical protein
MDWPESGSGAVLPGIPDTGQSSGTAPPSR